MSDVLMILVGLLAILAAVLSLARGSARRRASRDRYLETVHAIANESALAAVGRTIANDVERRRHSARGEYRRTERVRGYAVRKDINVD